jgi:Family of unknown function (DUF6161)
VNLPNEKKHLSNLKCIGLIAGTAILILYGSVLLIAYYYLNEKTPLGVIGVTASLLLLTTTCFFWYIRFMLKLYLSEHHLGIDADERAIMAETYLAFKNDGSVDEKDRALILTPLFRPSSDGIVKEDSSPDIGIAAILSKIINRP